MPRSLIFSIGFALVAVSCGGSQDVSTMTGPLPTSPVSTSPLATSPVSISPVVTSSVFISPIVDVPAVLADFDTGVVLLNGVELVVAIADSPELRPRGLMNVADLGSLDGMVFIWSDDTDTGFWMKDTVIALDIAWFDAAGRFVSETAMPICPAGEACPTYSAGAPYRFALELPEGSMPVLDASSRLVFDDEY